MSMDDVLYPTLRDTTQDFDDFRRNSSNYLKLESNTSALDPPTFESKTSVSDPPDFEFSSASFVIDFEEKVFEDYLKAETSHLKDDFSHSS